MLANWFTAFAIGLEILGALFLANHYLRVRFWQVPRVLLSALYGGNTAIAAALWAKLNNDDPLVSIRGIALIALGFLVQFIVIVIKIV